MKTELPGLKRFATLSPVPGFRRWMEQRLTAAEPTVDLLRPEERRDVFSLAGLTGDAGDDAMALQRLLQKEDWWNIAAVAAALRSPLLRACATCLTDTIGPRAPLIQWPAFTLATARSSNA